MRTARRTIYSHALEAINTYRMSAVGLDNGGFHVKADGAFLRFVEEGEILPIVGLAADTPPAMTPEVPLRGPVSTHTLVRTGKRLAVVVADEGRIFSIGVAVRHLREAGSISRADPPRPNVFAVVVLILHWKSKATTT